MKPSRLIPLLVSLTLALVSAATWAQTEPLGRLFFTPEKRAALDRQRQLNLTQVREATDENPVLTVNGLVRRSGGRSTTWVNGAAVDETNAIPGTTVSTGQGATVNVGERKLKVGESLNQTTGEKEDVLGGGQIRVQPGSPAKR